MRFVDEPPVAFDSTVTTEPRVAFHTQAFSYLGNDGVEYVNIIAAEWFGDVELFAALACPLDLWDGTGQAILEEFTDLVVIGPGYL